jgi:transcription initiation factor TFIIIB Brf1 subunit/transcription initiation factor TFIIB
MSAAKAVWVNQEVADDIASNALQILAKTSRQNLRFFCGKPPKCILGGLFYILGFRFKVVKTQSEIAYFLCTTEDSVRKSYNSWFREFPEQFTDLDANRLGDNPVKLAVSRKKALTCNLILR